MQMKIFLKNWLTLFNKVNRNIKYQKKGSYKKNVTNGNFYNCGFNLVIYRFYRGKVSKYIIYVYFLGWLFYISRFSRIFKNYLKKT